MAAVENRKNLLDKLSAQLSKTRAAWARLGWFSVLPVAIFNSV
jgi:hypothetical protein